MNSIDTLTTADRLALTLEGLCRAVAARVAGGAMAVVMILLVWRRVQRVKGQIQGLLARFQAGRLRVGVVKRSGGAGGGPGGSVSGLPRQFGWLLPMVPHEAACFAGQLRTVLAEPEMVALLEASPQARRVLAPLCRMLGIEACVIAGRGEAVVPVVVEREGQVGPDGTGAGDRHRAAVEALTRLAPPSGLFRGGGGPLV